MSKADPTILATITAAYPSFAAVTTKEVSAKGSAYPFITQNQIRERVMTDDDFTVKCLKTLLGGQTAEELAKGETIIRNKKGLGSSCAGLIKRLFTAMALEGEDVDPETGRIGEISPKGRETIINVARYGLVSGKGIGGYAKQLAAAFREEQLASDPALAAKTACFFQNNTKAA